MIERNYYLCLSLKFKKTWVNPFQILLFCENCIVLSFAEYIIYYNEEFQSNDLQYHFLHYIQ